MTGRRTMWRSLLLVAAVATASACESSTPHADSKSSAAPVSAGVVHSAVRKAAAPAAQAAMAAQATVNTAAAAKSAEADSTALPAAGKPAPPKAGEKAPPSGSAPAAKAAEGKLTQGAVASDEAYAIWLQAPSPVKAGQPVPVEVVLTAKPPYHCNAEYPHKFKLAAAPAGLSYSEETVRGMKVTPERSVMAIPVKADAPGKPTISGTLSFSVCTAERCMVEKRDVSLALEVD
jgi:hypothetical protein